MQALAGVRAETTPHPARREAWLTADLRYGGCERHLLPLVDADLADPVLVSGHTILRVLQSSTSLMATFCGTFENIEVGASFRQPQTECAAVFGRAVWSSIASRTAQMQSFAL